MTEYRSLDDQDVAQTMLKRVLEVIASKKATYARELARETGYSAGEISRLLYRLEDQNVLEQLVPQMKLNDQRLLDRRTGVWKRGIKGLDSWRNMNWFGLNSDLSWKLSPRGKNFFVDEYHRRLYAGDLSNSDYRKPVKYAEELINQQRHHPEG